MSLAIKTHTFTFSEQGSDSYEFNFNNYIKDYGAALQGFELDYGLNVNYNIQALGAEITDMTLSDDKTKLTVKVALTLHDKNNHIGKGQIVIAVFADVA